MVISKKIPLIKCEGFARLILVINMYFILKMYLQRLVKHFRRTSSAQSLKEILNESVLHGVKIQPRYKSHCGQGI
jgi:hypothetical protein